MFFTPGTHQEHGLPFNPLKAIVAPRPIGWISTVNAAGNANLAPYSFFNAISETPPMVGFSVSPAEREKDSLVNSRETGEFVVNIVSHAQMQAMSDTSAPAAHGVSEFDLVGIEAEPSTRVAPPRVKDAPCHLECKVWDILALPEDENGDRNYWVMGTIIGININDAVIVDGKVDVSLYQPVSRLGYKDYSVVRDVFEIERPKGGY
ncbi:flavin reductase family protein [Alphaproteobacteria bacterium LSUCC0684]